MLIEKNIQVDDSLWDRILEISKENRLHINAVISEALELFIDSSSYAEKK